MSSRRRLILLLLCSFTIVHVFVFNQLRNLRILQLEGNEIRTPSLPPAFAVGIAGEFQGLIADFLYLEAASFLGGMSRQTFNEQSWDSIEKILRTALAMDPNFEPVFRTVQAFFPWEGERPEIAIELLEQVYAARNWDWRVPFFLGFDHYFFFNDSRTASRYFMEASQLNLAPPLLATFAARLSAESGSTEAGIEFLQRVLQTKENSEEKRLIRERITALEGIKVLESALLVFHKDHHTNPDHLEELVSMGYLKELPDNPYYTTFFYKNGKVRFDPFR